MIRNAARNLGCTHPMLMLEQSVETTWRVNGKWRLTLDGEYFTLGETADVAPDVRAVTMTTRTISQVNDCNRIWTASVGDSVSS